MRKSYILLLLLPVFIISCNNNSGTSEKTDQPATPPTSAAAPTSKLATEANTKLVNMLNNYYALKDALVATSGDKANATAKQMSTTVDSFKTTIAKTDASISSSINSYIDTINTELSIIAKTDTKKINDIRMHFAKITGPLFALCKKLELKNSGVYLQHCPMAFDDSGANWLSNYSDIKNPYFGDKMLECGEIEDSLK